MYLVRDVYRFFHELSPQYSIKGKNIINNDQLVK